MTIDNPSSEVSTEQPGLSEIKGRRRYPFVLVPHWVLLSGLSSGALHLYCVMAKHADWDTGQLYAGQKTLAIEMNCSVRSVKSYFQELCGIRAVAVVRRRWNNSSLTVIALDVPLEPTEVEALTESESANISNSGAKNDTTSGAKNDYLTRTPIREPLKQESDIEVDSLFSSQPSVVQPMQLTREQLLDQEFDSIWTLYPKKVKKPDARRSFGARVKAGTTVDQLRKAVEYYAQAIEQRRREPDWHEKFVMHPTSFFGPNERWREYQDPPTVAGKNPASRSGENRTLELVRRMKAEAEAKERNQ